MSKKFRIISIKKALLIILFYTFLFLLYGYYSYNKELEEKLVEVDRELIMGANAVNLLLPPDYHHKGLDITKVSKEKDLANIKKLSQFVRYTHLAYIYSLIRDKEGHIRFSSSSATPQELQENSPAVYSFDIYDDDLAKRIFENNITTPVFDTSKDQWGEFRSVYILKHARDGYPYIVGADYKYQRIATLKQHILSNVTYLVAPLILIIALYVFANYFVFIYLRNSLAKKSKALKEAFEYDSLTKLPSKRKLVEDVKAAKETTPIAILDIDKFSIINDIYGSDYGDRYLQYTATVLHNRILSHMQLYRLDSDAFAIVCTQKKPLEDFARHISDILAACAQKSFSYNHYTTKLFLTAGVSDTARRDNPLIKAEIALKKAKENGERLRLYTEDIDSNNHNKEVLDEIIYAIENDKVFAYLQPIYDIKSEKVIKYEALMRIQKQDGTIAAPEYFLDIAKHTPFYKELTLAMLEHVIVFAQKHPEFEFSINLSSLDIENEELMEALIDKLLRAGVEKRITLEMLESEEFKDFEYLFEFVKKVRSLGIKISIDDFGSGYSNISSTIKLSIDYLKIDGSLIRHILVDKRYEKVIKSIVNFAEEMGATTIAEYVESEAIAKKLKELGIDMLQGYHIGKPSPTIV